MKTTLIFFYLIFFISILFAQENSLIVKYSYFNENSAIKMSVKAELFNNQKESLFVIYTKKTNPNTKFIDENNKISGELIDVKEEIYKDFIQNRLYGKSPIPFTMKLILKDSLNHSSWEITGNTKEILGYKCSEAKTSYHGRNYVAYFSEEIPIFDGPWKFSGLPGLILEIKEATGMLEIIAYELNIENKPSDITTTLDIENSFYWTELIEKAKIKFNMFKNESKKDDPTFNATIDSSNALEIVDIND